MQISQKNSDPSGMLKYFQFLQKNFTRQERYVIIEVKK